MVTEICGVCDLAWHTSRDVHGGFSGQIWTKELGYHKWQAPSKEKIRLRLRKKYGLS
jgi:hypothetical protein